MVKFCFLLNLIIIKILLTLIKTENCNYSFRCQNDMSENNCLTKIRTESPNIYDIFINPCLNSSCDVHDALLGETEKAVYCKDYKYTYKRPSYLNGSCYDNSQCLMGICKNFLCTNYRDLTCTSHENCPLNTFCHEGICINYLEDDDKCTESYQCKFNSFCDKKWKICRKLFIYADGDDITGVVDEDENMGEICKSGGYIKVREGKQIKYYCETLYNENISCRNTCSYRRKLNNESIVMEDKCLCGFNQYRLKYCVLGNGEKEFIDYLNIRKKFLFNDDYTKKCHTLERDSNNICNELINTNSSVKLRKFIQNYTNLKIEALEYHRIKDSDSCVKEVVFGYSNKPIIPIKQSCPRFSCDNSIKQCVYGINPLNEHGDNITIKLNKDICRSNEYCSINSEFISSKGVMKVMENENLEGECTIYAYWPGVKYPGEDCYLDKDCFGISRCENGKCTGANNGENCSNTYDCKVGLYCNKEIKKCTPQKNEGEHCAEGWDCLNYLGCYRGRCVKFGILKPGVMNTDNYSPFPGDERRYYLCNTGELDGDDSTTGNYCVKTKYSDEWIKNNKKVIDANGFIKCEYQEKCIYDNGRRTIVRNCGCGYNAEGQGYCPLPSSLRMDEWNNRIKNIADLANNGCHTLSRFNCYLQNGLKDFFKKIDNDKNTIKAHLFYNSISCVQNMFSFQKYLNINIFLFLLSLLFIYF